MSHHTDNDGASSRLYPATDTGGDSDSYQARARLIAAASDLLEALESFVNIPNLEHYGFENEVAQAVAAIAKAKGVIPAYAPDRQPANANPADPGQPVRILTS